jgi:hypothetical protein
VEVKDLDEAIASPPAEAVARMMQFNQELVQAGAFIALDGLHPRARGARVAFVGGKANVTDGPFTEAKDVIGGYWLIQANSKQDAVEWARRCPTADGDVIEVREVFELSDFPPDVQKAADNSMVRAHIEGYEYEWNSYVLQRITVPMIVAGLIPLNVTHDWVWKR